MTPEVMAAHDSGRAGAEPWPDTRALHWIELDVAVPASEGDHAWSIRVFPHEASHERSLPPQQPYWM